MNRFFTLVLFTALVAGSARADDAAPAPDEVSVLKEKNKELSEQLQAAWRDAEQLRIGVDSKPRADDAKAADLQDKLTLSLRSYSVLQDENTRLQADLTKANSDLAAAQAEIAELKPQAAESAQLDSLRTQLRGAQNEIGRIGAENASLRTRLALNSSPPPGQALPSRPAAAAPPAPAPAVEAPAPAKTHVVVEGETLSQISKECYGTPNRWPEILEANRDQIHNEKSLPIGMTLKIP